MTVAEVVGALLVAVGRLLAAKQARRRGQRLQSLPGRRGAGAWEHVLDRMAERGITLPPSLTAEEVAGRAADQLGQAEAAPISALAPVVDAARCDRRFPPSEAIADAAWAQASEFERSLLHGSPPLRRLRVHLSPAPLRRVTPSPRRRTRAGATH